MQASEAVPSELHSPGSTTVAQGLSCSAVCGIFLDQGSDPCLWHRQMVSLFLACIFFLVDFRNTYNFNFYSGNSKNCISNAFLFLRQIHLIKCLLKIHPFNQLLPYKNHTFSKLEIVFATLSLRTTLPSVTHIPFPGSDFYINQFTQEENS